MVSELMENLQFSMARCVKTSINRKFFSKLQPSVMLSSYIYKKSSDSLGSIIITSLQWSDLRRATSERVFEKIEKLKTDTESYVKFDNQKADY